VEPPTIMMKVVGMFGGWQCAHTHLSPVRCMCLIPSVQYVYLFSEWVHLTVDYLSGITLTSRNM